jgi:hypothetical protein
MFNAKKIATTIAAAALMMGVSTSAFAAFADLSLVRVVYERTSGTMESATDLGNINTLLAAPSTTIAGSTLTANVASNLFVAYFAIDRSNTLNGGPDFWVAGSTTSAPKAVGGPGFTTTKAATTSVFSVYNGVANNITGGTSGGVTGTSYNLAQSNGNSYKTKMSASQGAMNNMINAATRPFIEANLASLVDGTATSVTQNLYFFSNANLANSVGTKVATITTSADGSSTVTTTPIPAAIYLMGSGLLGLVGLRRRKEA